MSSAQPCLFLHLNNSLMPLIDRDRFSQSLARHSAPGLSNRRSSGKTVQRSRYQRTFHHPDGLTRLIGIRFMLLPFSATKRDPRREDRRGALVRLANDLRGEARMGEPPGWTHGKVKLRTSPAKPGRFPGFIACFRGEPRNLARSALLEPLQILLCRLEFGPERQRLLDLLDRIGTASLLFEQLAQPPVD